MVAERHGGFITNPEGGHNIGGEQITEFLGIYSGRVNKNSDIGIVWKASAIKELVNSI